MITLNDLILDEKERLKEKYR